MRLKDLFMPNNPDHVYFCVECGFNGEAEAQTVGESSVVACPDCGLVLYED